MESRIRTGVGADRVVCDVTDGFDALVAGYRAVKPKFLNYVVQTRDGRVLSGLIRGESANTITIRQPDGKEIILQRVEIEAMRGTRLSFMPQGLEKELDLQGMADLLEYLVPGK